MDRKKIIIDEIKYWKKSRLLPEQYCNFLLTLYTEGEEIQEVREQSAKPSISFFFPFMITIFGLAVFGLTFLVIYFTDFSSFLQTAIVIFLSILMFFLAVVVKRFDSRFVHLYILLGALMVFLATIHVTGAIFPSQPYAILGAVVLTCLLWLIIGKKYNLKYLLLSGVFGLIVSIYFLAR